MPAGPPGIIKINTTSASQSHIALFGAGRAAMLATRPAVQNGSRIKPWRDVS
jgi:hypothetical protein